MTEIWPAAVATRVMERRSRAPLQALLIESLDLGVRTYNLLKNIRIESVADVLNFRESELKFIGHFGKHSLAELNKALETVGVSLDKGPFRKKTG